MLLLIFTIFHLFFYLLQIDAFQPWGLDVSNMIILGYASTGVLLSIYLVVILQTIIQLILDYCSKYCKGKGEQ